MKKILIGVCLAVSAFFMAFILENSEKIVLERPHYSTLDVHTKKQIDCLAENIYHESRSEPINGQIAVAFVTLNRTRSEEFPDNVCDVVKQKTKRVCQFSWYCSRNITAKYNQDVYNGIRELAIFVYFNYEKLYDPSKGALFYHADYVKPNWKNLVQTTQISRHVFYVKE